MSNKKTNSKLYYFNPGHENAILNGSPYYTPPANIARMQADLESLPVWYADSNDCVYTRNALSREFSLFITNNGIPIAQTITQDQLDTNSSYAVHFWGISPQAIHFIEEINRQTGSILQTPVWNNKLEELSSRKTAAICLRSLVNEIPKISDNIIPEFYSDLNSIENTVALNKYQLLAKAPFSSSGRGLLWLPVRELTRTERQILHGILKKQKYVSIERALNKQIDFAMEFIISPDADDCFVGYSLFETNSKGAYTGNYLGLQSNIENTITKYIQKDLLESVKNWLSSYLKQNFASFYEGCIGVDMMIYLENDSYKLHPCVEINVRDNMGLLALRFSQNHLDKSATGHFYIDFSSKENVMYEKHIQMQEEHPLVLSGNKFTHGYFSLCPVSPRTNYRAYILLD